MNYEARNSNRNCIMHKYLKKTCLLLDNNTRRIISCLSVDNLLWQKIQRERIVSISKAHGRPSTEMFVHNSSFV